MMAARSGSDHVYACEMNQKMVEIFTLYSFSQQDGEEHYCPALTIHFTIYPKRHTQKVRH